MYITSFLILKVEFFPLATAALRMGEAFSNMAEIKDSLVSVFTNDKGYPPFYFNQYFSINNVMFMFPFPSNVYLIS